MHKKYLSILLFVCLFACSNPSICSTKYFSILGLNYSTIRLDKAKSMHGFSIGVERIKLIKNSNIFWESGVLIVQKRASIKSTSWLVATENRQLWHVSYGNINFSKYYFELPLAIGFKPIKLSMNLCVGIDAGLNFSLPVYNKHFLDIKFKKNYSLINPDPFEYKLILDKDEGGVPGIFKAFGKITDSELQYTLGFNLIFKRAGIEIKYYRGLFARQPISDFKFEGEINTFMLSAKFMI